MPDYSPRRAQVCASCSRGSLCACLSLLQSVAACDWAREATTTVAVHMAVGVAIGTCRWPGLRVTCERKLRSYLMPCSSSALHVLQRIGLAGVSKPAAYRQCGVPFSPYLYIRACIREN